MNNKFTDLLNPATADIIPPPAAVTDPPSATDTALVAGDRGTDLDASLRYAQAHADSMRYCEGIGWLQWDSRRWTHAGADAKALELAKLSARRWTEQTTQMTDENRAARIRGATALEGAHHLRAVVSLACSDPCFAVNSGELDLDPFVLNVLNGTLDLRTGALRPHNRRRPHYQTG